QLREYPTFTLLRDTVDSVDRIAENAASGDAAHPTFRIGTGHTARTIVLAQGVQFIPSEIPGVDALWGTKVVNCPFCDGYESRDMRVLGVGDESWLGHMGGMLPNWIDDLSWSDSAEIDRVEDVADGVRVTYKDGRVD